jgi:hypothetical protein
VVKSQLGSLGGVEDSRQQRGSSKVLTSSAATMLREVSRIPERDGRDWLDDGTRNWTDAAPHGDAIRDGETEVVIEIGYQGVGRKVIVDE